MPDANWADSLVIEDTVGWSIIKEDDEASLGHQTKQVHIISITKIKPVFFTGFTKI